MRSEAVLELGKKLVDQLDTKDDLLGSWMAHYVAERILAAEGASPVDRGAAQEACANAILKLWRHRNSLPHHLRPLGELVPIQRTLALLDFDRTDFRYYPAALREAAIADADDDSKQWLEFAIGLDYTARVLIQFALGTAARRAARKAQPWVDLALEAGADQVVESATVQFILGSDGDNGADDGDRSAALLDRLARLDSFAEFAASIARELRAELGFDGAEK